jgi:chromosome segregation ATPase
MRKALLPGLVAAVLAIVLVNAVAGNRRAIAEARADAARLETQRDSLLAEVRDRERRQAALAIERETHHAEASRLRDSVAALERRRADAQLTVRQIRTVGALQARLRSAFPELGDSAWGVAIRATRSASSTSWCPPGSPRRS